MDPRPPSKPTTRRNLLAAGCFLFLVVMVVWTVFSRSGQPLSPVEVAADTVSVASVTSTSLLEAEPPVPLVPRVPVPEEVRGIYWTADSAGSKRGDSLLAYMVERHLNTAVIDVQMDNGELAFTPLDPDLLGYRQADPAIEDVEELLKRLEEKQIYRIARIAIMRNGSLARRQPDVALKTAGGAIWRDKIGSLWVDPASPKVAAYAVAMAREAYARGFDEVQFDYIRFPSDGTISSIVYPVHRDGTKNKVDVMRTFFRDVSEPLIQDGIPRSFDVFGMTFWLAHDYNIGQRLIDVYPLADYVSPMVYPSHYPNGFKGLANPALYPYEIVKMSLDMGAEQLEREMQVSPTSSRPKFRPWLQDFDIGATYNAPRVEAQIKATRDAGASGWILWNARNVYEPYLNVQR